MFGSPKKCTRMICPELRATELSPEELLSIFRGLSIDDRLPRIIQQKTTQIKEAANQLTELQSEKEWVRRKADAQQQTETQTVTETAAERERGRQRQRETEKERERERDRIRETETAAHIQREREINTQTETRKHIDKESRDELSDRKINKLVDRAQSMNT